MYCSSSTSLLGFGRKEIFYLRFYGVGKRERNVLFNDALSTFYIRLYGVRHMVKDHSDSEKGNPLPPHRLLYRLTAKVLLYAPSHRQDNTYHGLCYNSRGALAGTRNTMVSGHMVKDHLGSKIGCRHMDYFPINSKGLLWLKGSTI